VNVAIKLNRRNSQGDSILNCFLAIARSTSCAHIALIRVIRDYSNINLSLPFSFNARANKQVMAFDRTERFAKLMMTTPTHVGPGTYDISDLTKPPRDPGNSWYTPTLHPWIFREICTHSHRVCAYATTCSADNVYPFLSGTSRQIHSIPKDAHKFPGPGSYNVEELRKRIPERAFFLFISHLLAIP